MRVQSAHNIICLEAEWNFNDLMNLRKNIGVITNDKVSKFRKMYKTLLDELGFVAV
jgi:hypothetical protein